jgi:hypothetical protein
MAMGCRMRCEDSPDFVSGQTSKQAELMLKKLLMMTAHEYYFIFYAN